MPVAMSSHTAVLQSVTPETPAIHTLRLDVPFKFKPGQLVQVLFPGELKKRFYSISSSPTEGPKLAIAITVKSEIGSTLDKAIRGLKQRRYLDPRWSSQQFVHVARTDSKSSRLYRGGHRRHSLPIHDSVFS